LVNACDEQRKELIILQNLMQDQLDRSIAITDQEDNVHHDLNSLEIEARNFLEESNLVSNSCSAVESELDAISRVRLMSIPFKIRINDFDDKLSGRGYPTINNLRLAYRINKKAGLCHDEINAAFVNSAHLLAFTLELYPSLNASNIIRIIPIHPCAKILVNLPDEQSVHNLGFDSINSMGLSHVPTRSIALFLVLLSQLSSHILSLKNQILIAEPPFHMTECSIDSVDVTKLTDSNVVAWSSVVFCIAANLRWLSKQEMGWSFV
jgi:hypothetical protein